MFQFFSSKAKRSVKSVTFESPTKKSSKDSQSPKPTDTSRPSSASISRRVVDQDVKSMSGAQLDVLIRKDGASVDPNICIIRGKMLLKTGIDCNVNRAKFMKAGLLLMEAGMNRDANLDPNDIGIMANGYATLWFSSGYTAEIFMLERSATLFESIPDLQSPSHLLMYSRVLQSLNRLDAASDVMTTLLNITDGDQEYPSYLLYAASIAKAQYRHEIAASYFFEASRLGPPRLFSKTEMIFLLSRNIEESTGDKDDALEDVYRIVFDHMKKEGRIPENLSYLDWINDAQIWMDLGHKCSIHGAHTLARDLYGQALMRDLNSFSRTKIWLRFSKSCQLCGLLSDAQLSIQQSLTVEPHNTQLLVTLKSWAESPRSFEQSVQSIAIQLLSILDQIPPELSTRDKALVRIQALFRGVCLRRMVNIKHFRHLKTVPTYAEEVIKRSNALHKMKCRLGVSYVIRTSYLSNSYRRPLVLTVRADWSGSIRCMMVLDIVAGTERRIMLPFGVFSPGLEYRTRRSLKVEMKWSFDPGTQVLNSIGINQNTNIPLVPMECEMGQIICLQFVDQANGQYISKCYRLAVTSPPFTRSIELRNLAAPQYNDGDDVSVLDMLSLVEVSDTRPTITTDIPTTTVAVGGVRWRQSLFLYRINHHYHRTYITCQQVSSNLTVRFAFNRIHFDCRSNIKRCVRLFLDSIAYYEPLFVVLEQGGYDDEPRESCIVSKSIRQKDKMLLYKFRLSSIRSQKYFAFIEVVDPAGESIFGHTFVTLDRFVAPFDRNSSSSPRSIISPRIDV